MRINWIDNLLFGLGAFFMAWLFCGLYEGLLAGLGSFIAVSVFDWDINR